MPDRVPLHSLIRKATEADQARTDFLKAFSCPDPTGTAAPCRGMIRRDDDPPRIRLPMPPGAAECPIWYEQTCEPGKLWQAVEDHRLITRRTGRGVPRRLAMAELIGEKDTPALQLARAYEEEGDLRVRKRALVLAGPTGVGKSYAAAALVNTVNEEHLLARFLFWPSVAGAILSGGERRDDVLEQALTTAFIALDDLGAEYAKAGGLVEAILDEIICTREAEERPMVITTNMTVGQMRERLSDRIVDRLAGWATLAEVTGPSLR